MATAARLTDHVLPDLPLRQWVVAVPKRLRAHSRGSGPAARLGAVAYTHRFGSTLNANLHFHRVVIDCVFEPAPTNRVVFRAATDLDATPITQVQAQVRRQMLRVVSVCCSMAPGHRSPW